MTISSGGAGFVAAHGRRSIIMGYPAKGLEVWAYPFQILSDYRIAFKPVGSSAETDARPLLRRVDYRPGSVTRVYVGPDYLVREKLSVPLNQPAAVISFEVEGTRQLDIAVHFQPVLNLMWPAALGAQYTRWSADLPGYLIAEPEHGFTAAIGSTDIVAHDDTVNSTVHAETTLSLLLRPHPAGSGVANASVYILLNEANTKDPAAGLHNLQAHADQQEKEVADHYEELSSQSLHIQTPDPEANRAIAWAEIALDQAWVCNPLLGCGIIAGYGPSRDARRPQYAWFFAGDGLIATNALISAGEYTRAKEELEFIAKYQQPATGMIWHELSQSAGYIDWSKYPYMYVHVDITADYLATVARYVTVSGDLAFAQSHWPSILEADGYCRSLLRAADHLPHIPPDKEGGDEQARPGDDLGLSAGVLAATSGFAQLATLTGHPDLALEATAEQKALQQAIAHHYWDATKNFWIDGHTQDGAPIPSRRRGPTHLIAQNVFSEKQNNSLLDQLASADFRTDWGLRGLAQSSPDYDPYSYGRGSVSAPAAAEAATAFWNMHRPEIGQSIWRDVLAWNTLDSPGHLHEVLAGNFYHEQTESVPEQTWSSAGLLNSTVRGLLGLEITGAENRITFTPHLPAEWDRVAIDNVRLPHSLLNFTVSQSMTGIDLDISNRGSPVQVTFEPQIPLGAELVRADYQGRKALATTEMMSDFQSLSEDEHARLTLQVPPGVSHCHLQIEGGLSLIEKRPLLHVGDPGTDLKITHLTLQHRTLSIQADIHPGGNTTFILRTPWKLRPSNGTTSRQRSNGDYEITIHPESAGRNGSGYTHTQSKIDFADPSPHGSNPR